MNGLAASLEEAGAVAKAVSATGKARVALCPPATLIERMGRVLAGSAVELGGQDCRAEEAGAFTGDVSAAMLVDAGASLVILGHSERRSGYGESSELIAAKAEAAFKAGLKPIICVGETLAEREGGKTLAVVEAQVRGSTPAILAGTDFAIAYEPVWAIGTGLTPTLEQIEEVHALVRKVLGAAGEKAPILYGGSVKPSNAGEILGLPEVGGALVGGASLKAADFLGIIAGA